MQCKTKTEMDRKRAKLLKSGNISENTFSQLVDKANNRDWDSFAKYVFKKLKPEPNYPLTQINRLLKTYQRWGEPETLSPIQQEGLVASVLSHCEISVHMNDGLVGSAREYALNKQSLVKPAEFRDYFQQCIKWFFINAKHIDTALDRKVLTVSDLHEVLQSQICLYDPESPLTMLGKVEIHIDCCAQAILDADWNRPHTLKSLAETIDDCMELGYGDEMLLSIDEDWCVEFFSPEEEGYISVINFLETKHKL